MAINPFIDEEAGIIMSLGKDKAASRGRKLGMEEVQVYQLRTVARGQTPKNPVEMPKESPAVTAGSSSESREGFASKPPDEPDLEKKSNSMFFDRTLTKDEREVYDYYSRPISSVSDREFMKTSSYQKMLAKRDKKFRPEILAKKQKNRDDLAEQRERKREARKTQGRLSKSATLSKRDKKNKEIERSVIRAGGDSLDVRKAQLARFASDQSKNPKNSR